jgi:hypothetical protein
MRFAYEAEYLRAAQRLGIPTAIPVFSWDNLTTKSLFPVLPDQLLVWNRTQVQEAQEIHNVPEDRIAVTGAALFDRWSTPGLASRSREAFCARVGLDPTLPFVCYLGSTSGIAQDETWLVRGLVDALRASADDTLGRLQLLIRPHPLNTRVYEDIQGEGVSIWPRGTHFPDSAESLQDFHDSLRYAVAAIGINTTAMLDAVIQDRPCIAFLAERYRRTQEQAVHFQHLRGAGVLEEVDGLPACLDVLAALLDGGDRKGPERQAFVREFIRPRGDGPAGAVAAEALEALVEARR